MDLEQFRVEIADGVATVTFDRPPVNAQKRRSREELTWVFDTLSDSDEVRAVILTGAGKVFSAGADIKERVGIKAEAGDYIRHNRLTRESFFAIADCAKPVIGAINGPAIGAGYALMACCDILLAADHAFVQMPEIDRGLVGGAKFLQLFPRSKARLMFFTGRKVPAPELYRLGGHRGLPRARCPDGRGDGDRARDRRQEPDRRPQGEAVLQRGRGDAAPRRLSAGARRHGGAVEDGGRARGAAAYLEKREPRFTGR